MHLYLYLVLMNLKKYENEYDMSNIYPYMWIAIFIASLGAYVP